MSLLDNASLLLTPNAYKEGKLYSVIPSNGNGDFTATRATTATRVNSAGLVDLVPYNLVQYSDMFSQAIWTKTRTSITANTETAPDGTLTADTLTANGVSGSHSLLQTTIITLLPNITYTTSIYAKKNTNNFIQLVGSGPYVSGDVWANFDLNNGVVGSVGALTTASIQSVGNGWYRCNMTATAVAFDNINAFASALISSATSPRFESNTLSTSVFVWGAQLVEGTSARDYLRTETRLNIPRIDYSLGGCPNILLEPQRTNLALQSSSFDSATWTKANSSVTANSTTSPSGIVDADTLTADGTTSLHIAQQSISVVNVTSYTISVYAKKNTNNFLQIVGGTSGFGVNVWANFDLNNGVVGSVGISTTARIENAGNGWYRCIIIGTSTATTSAPILLNIVTSATSLRGETNSLTTSVFLWGAQLEAGAYATSYIPTTTASVTRNADVLQLNGASALIGQTQGTIYYEARIGAADTSGVARMLGSISDGTANNRIDVYRFNNTIQYDHVVGNVVQFSGSVFNITNFNTTLKLAIRYSLNNVKTFVNGVLVNTDTTALIPACNQVNVGSNRLGLPTTIYGGLINETALFTTALTDTQLAQLTTL